MEEKKLKIPFPIIVEGKYDRLRLLTVCEARILTTDGFGIFKKNEKLALFRKLSEHTPIIILTDSDGAGKLIRSHLSGAVPPDKLIHVYIPAIKGKEKRKAQPSAAGTMGVEGMTERLLYDLLRPYEDESAVLLAKENPLCKADLYRDGLCGREDSAARRNELARRIGLPPDMTPNALLATLRILYTYEQYKELVAPFQ